MIRYLNTDLELESPDELTGLAAVLQSRGLFALHVERGEYGLWRAAFETAQQHTTAQPNIEALLTVIESLDGAGRSAWTACTTRELDIGYDCGVEPWAFQDAIASELLARIARVGASLRITIYPEGDQPAP
jgi:hypothetical protein